MQLHGSALFDLHGQTDQRISLPSQRNGGPGRMRVWMPTLLAFLLTQSIGCRDENVDLPPPATSTGGSTQKRFAKGKPLLTLLDGGDAPRVRLRLRWQPDDVQYYRLASSITHRRGKRTTKSELVAIVRFAVRQTDAQSARVELRFPRLLKYRPTVGLPAVSGALTRWSTELRIDRRGNVRPLSASARTPKVDQTEFGSPLLSKGHGATVVQGCPLPEPAVGPNARWKVAAQQNISVPGPGGPTPRTLQAETAFTLEEVTRKNNTVLAVVRGKTTLTVKGKKGRTWGGGTGELQMVFQVDEGRPAGLDSQLELTIEPPGLKKALVQIQKVRMRLTRPPEKKRTR
jgi:hypothetical protein